MFELDDINPECFTEACEELGVDPNTTEHGDNITVDELALEKTLNKMRMRAEYIIEDDR